MKIERVSSYKHLTVPQKKLSVSTPSSPKPLSISFGSTVPLSTMFHNYFLNRFSFSEAGNDFEKLSRSEQFKIFVEQIKQNDLNDYLWAKSWDYKKARAQYNLQYDKEVTYREESALFYLKDSTKRKIKTKYDNLYNQDLARYNSIMKPEKIPYYEKLLKENVTVRPRSLAEIMKQSKNTIDSKIAGYEHLKNDMREVFINPVMKELLEGGQQKVKNGILLCGPTGCGKTVVAEAIANETYCHVDRIETDTSPEDFDTILSDKIRNAKLRYNDIQNKLINLRNSSEFKNMTEQQRDEALKKIGSPRTVIIIDEFDRYFNPVSVEKVL